MLALLDANLRAWLSVWEVQSVSPGVGLALRDRLTGEERFIHEVSGSRSAAVRDALLAKVVDFDGISFSAATHPQPLGPRDAEAILRESRNVRGKVKRRITKATLRDPDHQLDLIDLWREQVERIHARPMPALTNTDGDPFALTTDHFDVAGGGVRPLIERLRSFPGTQEPEEGLRGETVIVVTKPGNAMQKTWDNTVVGRIVLSARRMSVESNSTRRADRLRADLETHLGGLVSHRLREETSQQALMEHARAASDAPVVRRSQPPELAAIARELRQRTMTAWLDEPVPALKGLTPRQAAVKPKMKAALDLLLRDFEHMEARLPPADRIDIASLRAELGVPG